MPTDPSFYLIGGLAVLMAGLSKGGFGSGAAFASTPLLAVVVGPAEAAAILLPILCLMDIIGMRAYWRQWDWKNARALMIAMVPGVAIGALTFGFVNDDALRMLIGALALLFLLDRYYRMSRSVQSAPFSARRAGFWGAVAGFTSFAAHAGGPPAAMHLLTQNLSKTTYQATTVIAFWWVNIVKLPAYGALGLFPTETLTSSLALAVFAPLGMILGIRAHHRISEKLYYRVVYVLLAITGAKLVYDGATGLLS